MSAAPKPYPRTHDDDGLCRMKYVVIADAERDPKAGGGDSALPPEGAAEIPGPAAPVRLDGFLPGNN